MTQIKLLVVALSALILAACGSSAELPDIDERLAEMGYLMGPGNQQIPRYRISSWNTLDDRHLIVRSGVRDEYLVQLNGPCFGLDSAFFVGFATPTSRVDSFGEIVVGSGRDRERCQIRDIYLLADLDDLQE